MTALASVHSIRRGAVKGKFDRAGMLAIDPKAFGLEFFLMMPPEREAFVLEGSTACVDVGFGGPLTQHADWWCDSYDAIRDRVRLALESEATNVLLEIDTPGGDVAGCFELARELRAMCETAGKPLRAWVDNKALSGGYAIASAAETIAIGASAFVGSIGVIVQLENTVGLDARIGLGYTIIASGARKGDFNPHTLPTDDAKAKMQRDVDDIAKLFYALVAEHRSGLEEDAVEALEASCEVGASAVSKGLADIVTTRSALLADLSTDKEHRGPSATSQKDKPMAAWKDEMKKAAEEGDEEAKKALAALDDDGDNDGDKPPSEEKPKEEGEETDEEKEAKAKKAKAEEDEKEKKAAAAANVSPLLAEAFDRVGSLERQVAANTAAAEAKERAELLAAHDLTDGQRKLLAGEPIANVRKLLAQFAPKAKTPVNPANASRVTGTQGGGGSSVVSPTISASVDAKMGLSTPKVKPHWEGKKTRVYPGVSMTKETAREVLEANRKAGRGIR